MKKLLMLVFVQITFALVGCDGPGADFDEKVEATKDRLDYVQSMLIDVDYAVSNLQSEIDDFQYEDWRDNVSDVKDAADTVKSLLIDLDSAVSDLDYELRR